jgi:signal transduction histidine kinase
VEQRSIVAAALVGAGVALGAGSAHGLDPARRITQYDRRAWTEKDGLPQASVFALLQTPDGYLWVGTDGGLARFDGVSFRTYGIATGSLRSNQVRALAVDARGDLWIGTKGGEASVRRSDGTFEHHDTPRTRLSGDGALSFLQSGSGDFWIGGWFSVVRRHRGGYVPLDAARGFPTGTVWAMREDGDGGVWFASDAGGLVRWRDGEITTPFARELGGARIRALLIDPDGTMWIGTEKGAFRRQGGVFRHFTRADGLPDDVISALHRDRDGNLWLGTERGLVRFAGGAFETLGRRDGVAGDGALSLAEDSEGNLWVGTRTSGLLRLSNGKFTTITTAEGLPTDLTTAVMQARDGALWIGTGGAGVVRVHGNALQTHDTTNGLCVDRVMAIHEDRSGRIWVGGVGRDASLCRLEDGRWKPMGPAQGFRPRREVRVVFQDRDDTIWIGAEGLHRMSGDRVAPEPLPGAPGPGEDDNVFMVDQDRAGDLWVGTAWGLVRRSGGSWRAVPTPERASLMMAMHEDADGTKWFASWFGLVRLRGGVFTPYAGPQGLGDETTYTVLADGAGDLWSSSMRGVFRVPRGAFEAYDRGARRPLFHTRFGVADGMKTDHCQGESTPAAVRARDGKLWFATSRGLASIDPANVRVNDRPPPVRLERLVVDGHVVAEAARRSIPPGPRDVRVEFAVLSFTAPEKVRFRYRLEPFDARPVEATGPRVAHYTNVPPGRYRFHVAAANDDGVWNTTGAAWDLELRPYIHETRYFQGLVAVALGLALWLLYRRRMAHVEARHAAVLAERARLAREIHDTLAQGFTGISLHLEAVAQGMDGRASNEARENLDRARSLARQSLTEARRAVWQLRTEAPPGGLVDALTSLAREGAGATPARLGIHGAVRALPPPIEEIVLKTTREALLNAQKHARATQISIDVTFEPDAVEVTVGDDGAGFDAAADFAAAGHFGLRGVCERAAEAGGHVDVRSSPGAGTQVTVRLPAPAASPSGRSPPGSG